MDKSKKITIGLYVLSIFLILGISYAYFSLNIIGNDTAKLSIISSGTLELTYSDTNEIMLDNAVPGDSFQKEISVKNTGTLDAMYNIIWQELTNEFVRNEIVVSATCERLNSEGIVDGTCNNIEEKPVGRLSIPQKISIEPNITHKYIVTVKFIDTGKNQNYNQGKTFNGKLGIEESTKVTGTLKKDFFEESGMTDRNLVKSISFYSDNRVADDAGIYDVSEEQNGSVKMYVKQNSETNSLYDISIVADGIIAFPKDSSSLFYFASGITCGRTSTQALEEINFNKAIDTSNVTNMSNMFAGGSHITTLDLSSFDTSNVADMSGMFWQVDAKINFENFNTSKVTNMNKMFYQSHANDLDLSSFDTSNVTSMYSMFDSTESTNVNLSSFNTNNVTSMHGMFLNSKITTLDLSNFDTSNVTKMDFMFFGSTNLKTIYASDKFNTNTVTGDTEMFKSCTSLVGGSGTKYSSSYTDKTYARIDGGTSSPGYFTAK